jgi:DsbC/DsbD-like thiol-disulfide interchange protein
MIAKPPLFLIILCFLMQPAVAQTDYVSMQLVKSLSPEWIGIDIKLQRPWKTYWHTPGEAGIAPTFNWSGSENLKSVTIHWPAPVVEYEPLQQNVYVEDVILPVHIEPLDSSKPVVLDLEALIGICADICIPVEFRLTGTIETLEISYDLTPPSE